MASSGNNSSRVPSSSGLYLATMAFSAGVSSVAGVISGALTPSNNSPLRSLRNKAFTLVTSNLKARSLGVSPSSSARSSVFSATGSGGLVVVLGASHSSSSVSSSVDSSSSPSVSSWEDSGPVSSGSSTSSASLPAG